MASIVRPNVPAVTPPLAETIVSVRLLVGALGEKPAANGQSWWPGHFTSGPGLRSLEKIFPKSWAQAALESVVESARRTHDDRLGALADRAYHLFRLPDDVEDRVADWLRRPDVALPVPPDGRDAILQALRAYGVAETAGAGPLCLGRESRLLQASTYHELAGTYLLAADTGATVFPYFEE